MVDSADPFRVPIGSAAAGEDDAARVAGVASLGVALAAHAEDVVAGMRRRATDGLDEVVEAYFTDMALVSTRAFAQWLSGASADVAREAGRDAWVILGQLAATREAALSDVIKRQLQWRDSAEEVLLEAAAKLGSSDAARAQALAMLQRSLDVTLVRMGGSFENERRRTNEALARREDELTFLATHDPLTDLPNRTLTLDRLDQMLARAARDATPAAAVVIDLDNFQAINDSLGHKAGDELLRAFAARLSAVVNHGDALGRLGGDEFVILAEDLSRSGGPELLAERLLEVLHKPFVLSGRGGMPLTVSASVGVAVGHRDSAEDMLHNAEIAMVRAKRDGINRYVLFESGMERAAQSNLELEMDLHTAVQQEQFFLVYQPIFDLCEMRPKGMEALLRWNHPVRGTLLPGNFVSVLEKSDLICAVGKWVLEQACLQAAAWHAAGIPTGISVNVSGRQLDSEALIDEVRDALAGSGLDPRALTIEITETALMRDVEATARRLTAIQALGVRIDIDDFGTGYSSLAHLQKFPVDSLKIDRSFVAQMTGNPESETMIETLVQLGKALSIKTIAEGIEDSAQLEKLIKHNCDFGQGFLFARPLASASAATFLRDRLI